MTLKKVGDHPYILYLEECPQCGGNRTVNTERLWETAGMTAAGLAAASFVGVPVLGMFGAVGILQLLFSGSISLFLAARLVYWNYQLFSKLNKEAFYLCPKCGCTDLTV